MSMNLSLLRNNSDSTVEDNQSSDLFHLNSLFPPHIKDFFSRDHHGTDGANLNPLTDGDISPGSYVESLFQNFSLMSDANEIVSFLDKNSFLLPILQEAGIKIKEYFNVQKKDLHLKLFEDPETGNKKIILIIMVSMSPDEALERLNTLRTDWWLNVLDKTHWKMTIDVDFV